MWGTKERHPQQELCMTALHIQRHKGEKPIIVANDRVECYWGRNLSIKETHGLEENVVFFLLAWSLRKIFKNVC